MRNGSELTDIQAEEQRPLILPAAECEQNKSLPAHSVLGKRARPEWTPETPITGGGVEDDEGQSESGCTERIPQDRQTVTQIKCWQISNYYYRGKMILDLRR